MRKISSPFPRTKFEIYPIKLLGVDAPDAQNAERHDLQLTKAYFATLPEQVQQHLTYRLVDALEPIHQAHSIEGLMMGEA